jgi:hypothetical protein
LNLAMIVFSALMIWKGLMFVTKVRTFIHYLSLCTSCTDTLLIVGKPRRCGIIGKYGTCLSTRRHFVSRQFRPSSQCRRCRCL